MIYNWKIWNLYQNLSYLLDRVANSEDGIISGKVQRGQKISDALHMWCEIFWDRSILVIKNFNIFGILGTSIFYSSRRGIVILWSHHFFRSILFQTPPYMFFKQEDSMFLANRTPFQHFDSILLHCIVIFKSPGWHKKNYP